jgi:hypothetical protein
VHAAILLLLLMLTLCWLTMLVFLRAAPTALPAGAGDVPGALSGLLRQGEEREIEGGAGVCGVSSI